MQAYGVGTFDTKPVFKALAQAQARGKSDEWYEKGGDWYASYSPKRV
jgi:hypothetical protein